MSNDEDLIIPKKEIVLGPMPKKLSSLGQLILMAGAMGAIKPEIARANKSQATVERDPRFHRLEKISPSEYFISTGPGELEGQYYACIMKPNDVLSEVEIQILKRDDPNYAPYIIVAKCHYGFDDPKEAMMDAGRQFPSLPVLLAPDEYSYPFHNSRKASIVQKAQERRERQAEKRAKGYKNAK